MLDYDALAERFEGLADQYASAHPFPHVVLENVFPADVLREVAAEFAPPGEMPGQHADEAQIKSTESRWERFGPATRAVAAELTSGAFTGCLTRLTGIERLIVDADYVGAGQHQIRRGGLLKIHADFDRHLRTGLDRRLNVLVYLNEPWEDDWGGELELWDPAMTDAVRIPPRLGTMVIFTTTDESFHGHPDPLRCPPEHTRKSLALYYYTSPLTIDADRRSTDFRRRPGEAFHFAPPRSRRDQVKRWVPPALLDAARSLRSR